MNSNIKALTRSARLFRGSDLQAYSTPRKAFCFRCAKNTETKLIPLSSGLVGNCCAVCRACRKGHPYVSYQDLQHYHDAREGQGITMYFEQLHLDHIPADLKSRDQWVGFKVTDHKKTPCVADDPTRKASCTNRETWRPFSVAAEGVRRGVYNSVAYALNSDFIGLDLDHCLRPRQAESFRRRDCGALSIVCREVDLR